MQQLCGSDLWKFSECPVHFLRPVLLNLGSAAHDKNPTLKDKCWVKGRISLLGKLVILGEKLMHVPRNQLPIMGRGKGFLKQVSGVEAEEGAVRSIILKSVIRAA